MAGLAPPSPAGPPQPIEHARGDVLALLSDRAKALVLGELLDMRLAFAKGQDERGVKIIDSAIRRVARGLYRLQMADEAERQGARPPEVDFDPTTGMGAL